ncbi:MAG: CHAD domain-containing protein [Verrucomicrobiales bacterium]
MPSRAPSAKGVPAFGSVAKTAAATVRGLHSDLAKRPRWNEEDIHHVRVLFKKLRALVHLGRGIIPGNERREWNTRLGETSRALASAREATILRGWVETAVLLAPPEHERFLGPLLAKLKADFSRRLAPGARTTVLETLDQFATEARDKWGKLGSPPRSGLQCTAEQVSEKAREALGHGEIEAWHQWRRRVKYAAYQREWIALAKKCKPAPIYRTLRQIGSALGKSNDMHNLRAWLAKRGGKSALAQYLDAWAEDAAIQWEDKARVHWKKLVKTHKSLR